MFGQFDLSQDRGEEMAYAAGNLQTPEACIGCHNALSYQPETCELCRGNFDPDPRWEIERRATWIIEAAGEIIRFDRGRRDVPASVDSPTFQQQIKEPMSALLDGIGRLLDATNSSVAVLDRPERKESWWSQLAKRIKELAR